mgnify:FL=1
MDFAGQGHNQTPNTIFRIALQREYLCFYISNVGLATGSTVTRSRQTESLSFGELPTWTE